MWFRNVQTLIILILDIKFDWGSPKLKQSVQNKDQKKEDFSSTKSPFENRSNKKYMNYFLMDKLLF